MIAAARLRVKLDFGFLYGLKVNDAASVIVASAALVVVAGFAGFGRKVAAIGKIRVDALSLAEDVLYPG